MPTARQCHQYPVRAVWQHATGEARYAEVMSAMSDYIEKYMGANGFRLSIASGAKRVITQRILIARQVEE